MRMSYIDERCIDMYKVEELSGEQLDLDQFKELCYKRTLRHAGVPEEYRHEAQLVFDTFKQKHSGNIYGKVCIKEKSLAGLPERLHIAKYFFATGKSDVLRTRC